ncbi:GNAT family N-acetyltransferase [Actinokineospora globicatena]|uniref:GNAT family N-acetyltransferase n=1 Tax=Actinokineospora globicatena TaxID=103729 RepID=UPI0020A3D212|nr:GNAT family N-acetyltransferase [Actinokineospora globicatena]MCP2304418.1 putative acetyltransferase [Actinokineospora globicatena]GLW78217.1 hypothetical protein Aglo01_26990 [Actinokineospora globicatena]GLW85117.1 hypothetical protein Aglo02_27570 [Actinokineospora globicatena]
MPELVRSGTILGPVIALVPVSLPDKAVLANLVQLYLHDFSEFRTVALSPQGTFSYPYLDQYFVDPDREAHFITVDAALAGFSLARIEAGAWTVAEFFIARGYRRRGIARTAALLQLALHPGPWTIEYDNANHPAATLWHSIAPLTATETRLQAPARTRLSFVV